MENAFEAETEESILKFGMLCPLPLILSVSLSFSSLSVSNYPSVSMSLYPSVHSPQSHRLVLIPVLVRVVNIDFTSGSILPGSSNIILKPTDLVVDSYPTPIPLRGSPLSRRKRQVPKHGDVLSASYWLVIQKLLIEIWVSL